MLKLTIKTPERRQWRRSGVFTVNFEHVIAGWELSLCPCRPFILIVISVIIPTIILMT